MTPVHLRTVARGVAVSTRGQCSFEFAVNQLKMRECLLLSGM